MRLLFERRPRDVQSVIITKTVESLNMSSSMMHGFRVTPLRFRCTVERTKSTKGPASESMPTRRKLASEQDALTRDIDNSRKFGDKRGRDLAIAKMTAAGRDYLERCSNLLKLRIPPGLVIAAVDACRLRIHPWRQFGSRCHIRQ